MPWVVAGLFCISQGLEFTTFKNCRGAEQRWEYPAGKVVPCCLGIWWLYISTTVVVRIGCWTKGGLQGYWRESVGPQWTREEGTPPFALLNWLGATVTPLLSKVWEPPPPVAHDPCQNAAQGPSRQPWWTGKNGKERKKGHSEIFFKKLFFLVKRWKKESKSICSCQREGLFLLSLCFPIFLSSPHVIVFCIKPP